MNFISISTTQSKASLSYFVNDKNSFTFEASRELAPSVWLTQSISFLEKNYNDFWNSLNYIAVDVGPGSFTGIKVGLSFVKSIAMARKIFLVPICSTEALAFYGLDSHKIIIFLNAHRNLFYFAIYEKKENLITKVYEPNALSLKDSFEIIAKFLNENICFITEKTILGFLDNLEKNKITDFPPLSIAVGELSKIYRNNYKAIQPESIEPIYIRQPDVFIR